MAFVLLSEPEKLGFTNHPHEVYQRILDKSREEFSALFDLMFTNINEFKYWDLDKHTQTHLLKVLAKKKSFIKTSFNFRVDQYFKDFKLGRESRQYKQHKSASDPFSITLTNITCEAVLIERISLEYGRDYQQILDALFLRLKLLVNRPTASKEENPLNLKLLCAAFHYAIDTLHIETRSKLALFRLFENKFIGHLQDLYETLDSTLYDLNIMPELSRRVVQIRQAERQMESMFSEKLEALKRFDEPTLALKENQSEQQSILEETQNFDITVDFGQQYLAILHGFKQRAMDGSIGQENECRLVSQELNQIGKIKYSQKLNTLAEMFDLILYGVDLPGEIKEQLARLQYPVFQTVVEDNSFFLNITHPARKLIDCIIENELIRKSDQKQTSSTVDFLQDAIKEIVSKEKISEKEFYEVLDAYKKHLAGEPCIFGRRYRVTSKLLNDIALNTNTLDLQQNIILFFKDVWTPLLVDIAINDGLDSYDWKHHLTLTKMMIWSLTIKSSKKEIQHVIRILPLIQKSMAKSFNRLNISATQIQQIFKMFNVEHSRVVKLSHRKIKFRELRIGKSFLNETRNMIPARANHSVSPKMIIEQKLDQIAAMPVDEQQFAAENFLDSLNS